MKLALGILIGLIIGAVALYLILKSFLGGGGWMGK